jgi:hypothetical protein
MDWLTVTGTARGQKGNSDQTGGIPPLPGDFNSDQMGGCIRSLRWNSDQTCEAVLVRILNQE